MADTDVIRGEEAALKKAQWRKLSEGIVRDWHRTDYYPRKHLDHVQHQGDAVILQHMARREHERTPSGRMPEGAAWWLAYRDMVELWDNYASQTFRQRA